MTPRETTERNPGSGIDYSNGRWKLLENWMEQIHSQIESLTTKQEAGFAEMRKEISQLRERVKSLEVKEGFHAGKWQTVFLILSPIITGVIVGLVLWLVTRGAKADEEVRDGRAPGDRGGVEWVLGWPEGASGVCPGGTAGDRRVVSTIGLEPGGRV